MVDLAQLREWSAALNVGELDPNEPEESRLYVELVPRGQAQVDEIAAAIQLAIETESVHLVSGPRGSGKSSELLRLRRNLEARGHTVVFIEMLDYVSESNAIDIEIFLIVMGLAISEALDPEGGGASFSEKLRGWVAQWRPTELTAEAGIDGPVSASIAATFAKVERIGPEIRSNPVFVEWLRDQVTYFLRDLKERIDTLIADLASEHGNGTSLVVVVDSLEKVGTTMRHSGAADSASRLFVDHPQRLIFPRTHIVYTVPPIAPVVYSGFERHLGDAVLHQIAVPRVGHEDHGGLPVTTFVDAINRRVDDVSQILGDDDLDRLVYASGGHFDDLFNLVRLVLRIGLARQVEFPVPGEVVDAALADLRASFDPGTEEQVAVVRWVAEHGRDQKPGADIVHILAHQLATHIVLHRRNDHDWYDVHPLTLEAVGLSS